MSKKIESILKRAAHLYRVNADGTIYSLPKRKGFVQTMEKILKGRVQKNGYMLHQFSIGNRSHWMSTHRIVWVTFRGAIPRGLQINHKDGNKLNNKLSNLELVSASQNIKHAHENGLMPSQKGRNNPASKLTESQVTAIKRQLHLKNNQELAQQFGVSHTNISLIRRGISWTHVP